MAKQKDAPSVDEQYAKLKQTYRFRESDQTAPHTQVLREMLEAGQAAVDDEGLLSVTLSDGQKVSVRELTGADFFKVEQAGSATAQVNAMLSRTTGLEVKAVRELRGRDYKPLAAVIQLFMV